MGSHDEDGRTEIDWSRWEFDEADLKALASGAGDALSEVQRDAIRDAIDEDTELRARYAALLEEAESAPEGSGTAFAEVDGEQSGAATPNDLHAARTGAMAGGNAERTGGLRRLASRPVITVAGLVAITLFLTWFVPFLDRAAFATKIWLSDVGGGNSSDGLARDSAAGLTVGDVLLGTAAYEAAVLDGPDAYPGAASGAMRVAEQDEGEALPEEGVASNGGDGIPPIDASRRVIKDGNIAILVDSVQMGVNRVESIATSVGGYILETNTDYGRGDGRRATVRLAVPVDRFEDTLQRIRQMATEVESESSSGTDVTQEYVDLQAQIANLEATRARVRTFLEEADSVEEALSVNARLTEIEAQIAQRKGRLEFLRQRSAHSTITVHLREPAPEIPPQPTATPAPLTDWSAGATASDAFRTLRIISRGLATMVIWIVIVFAPIAVPIAAGLWLIRWAWRKR